MSILEQLSHTSSQVFDADLSPDHTTLTMTEACDGYFSKKLNKAEVLQLINELQEIHKTMVELPLKLG